MKVLRHEEFQTGCEATCNGPYEGRWSKSMLGYGDESVHFVLELTYNYGVKSYQRGNDLVGIFIDNADAVKQVEQRRIGCRLPDGRLELSDPDGHKIFLSSNPSPIGPQLVKVALATDDMTKSVNFWQNLAKMTIYNQSDRATLMGYAGDQCKLELTSLPTGVSLTRGAAFGRIAFSAPEAELSEIQSVMRAESQTILTPLIILDTPGKASVTVVIVADPNGHEICYVGDEGFRQLSQPDPNANQLLLDAISQDFSDSGNKQ